MTHRHTAPAEEESQPFHFETTWRVDADPRQVWEVLSDLSSWPDWWPGMRSARMHEDGRRADMVVQAPFGYRLNFTLSLEDSRPPHTAEFSATGDLRGLGDFRAEPDGAGTRMTILWCVVTRSPLLRVARPVAGHAHDLVMAAGQRGLRRACARPAGGRALPVAPLRGTVTVMALLVAVGIARRR